MLVVNLYYNGECGSAKEFVDEMISSGLVDKIRSEEGNIGYEYFYSKDDPETVLLVDKWKNQEALDIHHKSDIMKEIATLRQKYNLKLKPEKYIEYKEKNNGIR